MQNESIYEINPNLDGSELFTITDKSRPFTALVGSLESCFGILRCWTQRDQAELQHIAERMQEQERISIHN